MKKSLLLSILIHSLIVFSLLYKSTVDKKEEQDRKLEQAASAYAIEIIEISDSFSEKETKQELKNYYWGIGITQDFNNQFKVNGIDTYGVMVVKVVPGYNGERDGILPDDFIIAVNGIAWSLDNDIKGDGPLKLVLTVYRNGVIIDIHTERCKVYF